MGSSMSSALHRERAALRVQIGVLASIAHRLPPVGYGPWEQIASTLTEGFVARGHEVTLFASRNSVTSATLHPTSPAGYEEDRRLDAKVEECLHIAAAFEQADEFDVLANHFDFLPLSYSRLVRTPMVTTIHGFSSERIVPVFRAYDDIAHYVAISDADRHPDLHYAATIHHGIDVGSFSFAPAVGSYLLFLGRIHPDKGTDLAIEVALRAGVPLVIAGIMQDQVYFDTVVKPRVNGTTVRYVGPVGPVDRDALDRRRAGDAAPDPVRRTVRPQRGRVTGLRHTGDRHPAWLAARAARRRCHRIPGARRRRGGRRGRPGRTPGSSCLPRRCGNAVQRRPDDRRLPGAVPTGPRRACCGTRHIRLTSHDLYHRPRAVHAVSGPLH